MSRLGSATMKIARRKKPVGHRYRNLLKRRAERLNANCVQSDTFRSLFWVDLLPSLLQG